MGNIKKITGYEHITNGNNGQLLLACTVVEKENDEEWTFLINGLVGALDIVEISPSVPYSLIGKRCNLEIKKLAGGSFVKRFERTQAWELQQWCPYRHKEGVLCHRRKNQLHIEVKRQIM